MDLDLSLALDARGDDRVVVRVGLQSDVGITLDGLTLQLVGGDGDALAPMLLMPVPDVGVEGWQGAVELRGAGPLPDDARVVAVAWAGPRQVRVEIPTSPTPDLREFVGSSRRGLPHEGEVILTPLSDADRAVLEGRWPWMAQPLRPAAVDGVIEARDEPSASDVVDDLGLPPEEAAWLHELLDDDIL